MATATMPMMEVVAKEMEDRDLDLLAIELWQRASCPEADNEESPDVRDTVGGHASCL
jgi:hypothetical protein